MACPSLEQLLGGSGADHAASCARCRAILALAETRGAAQGCGLVEALLAARALGPLLPENEEALRAHLESCRDCRRLARDIGGRAADGVLGAHGAPAEDLPELTEVGREYYERGREIGRGGMGRVVLARDLRLGRAVAIKELLDSRLQERFEREARLTARLEHPAIVSVHEAGRWPSGEPFYAMKYVAGRPLHQVIAETATLAQRLSLLPHFITVSEAIAYAHSEGVVHRDLKPHNILVGAFGETVVIDWGLAKELLRDGDDTGGGSGSGSEPLTVAGAGTPAYMPPEQARGEAPDVGVDIYALGATLHHILAGEPPGPGTRELPDEVPAELRAIVRKAMMPERADRYRSAAELVEELKRFQTGQLVRAHRYSPAALARRWLRRHRGGVLGITALAAAVALFVTARRTAVPVPSCEGGAARLSGAWDPSVRSTVERSFLASGRPYAADTFRRVAEALDGYGAAWSAMHREACEATAIRHEQSEARLDLRMQCLDRRLGDLRALTGLFGRAPDADLVDRAVVAVHRLDDIGACGDDATLASIMPVPTDLGRRGEIESLRGHLHEVHALTLAGKYGAGLEVVRPLVTEADRLGDPPLQLEATSELSALQMYPTGQERKDEEAIIRRWLELASRVKNDREIARGWIRLAYALIGSDRSAEAIGLLTGVAEVALTRADDPGVLRCQLLIQLSRAHEDKGQYVEAEQAARRALAVIEATPDHDDVDVAGASHQLGIVMLRVGKYPDAAAAFGRTIEVRTRIWGPDHPQVGAALSNLAIVLVSEGRYEEALTANRRALEIFEGAFGPEGAYAAGAVRNLAHDEMLLGRYQDSLAHIQRALAIEEKSYGPASRDVAAELNNLGVALARVGRFDDAEQALDRGRAIEAKLEGVDQPEYAQMLDAAALVAQLRGRCPDAVDASRRALVIYEKSVPKDSPRLVDTLLRIGQCELDLGRPGEAISPLQRAVAIRDQNVGDPAELADAQFALGSARFALNRHDPAAFALVISARAGLELLGPVQKARAGDADRWLAAHLPRDR